MLQGVEEMFRERSTMTYGVKKSNYKIRCEEFVEKYGQFLDEMDAYVKEASDKEQAAKEIGKCMMEAVKEAYSNRFGKLPSKVRGEVCLQLIYFFFPMMLKQSEDGKIICDGVLEVAQKELKNKDLRYADYDTINGGFQSTFFGFVRGKN